VRSSSHIATFGPLKDIKDALDEMVPLNLKFEGVRAQVV